MSDALEQVLRLVAEGRLSAEEAAPILAALDRADDARDSASDAATRMTSTPPGAPRFARIEVAENGRRVVDLRIPISLGRFALGRVPGISAEQVANVEAAIAAGSHGPILDVRDEDGDSVRIVLE
ncbi:MAG: hypothetical protein L0221_20080 [Chloroflexi bacterium]|nr:hypothetical protein [Chloroflexota bacterium]